MGGFPIQAAEQVCAGEGIAAEQVLSILYRLIDKSIVAHSKTNSPVSRFRMLEVVRQYGLEKLNQSGEERTIRQRHFQWCLSFARQAGQGASSAERSIWITQVENELPNLRQAFQWSLSGYLAPEMAHRLAAPLDQFWQLRGYIREGLEWYEAALTTSIGVPYTVLSETLYHASYMALHLWVLDKALQYAEKALAIWQEMGDAEGTAQLLSMLGLVYIYKNDFPMARRVTTESLALYETIGPRFGGAVALWVNGEIAFVEGNYRRAEDFYTRSLEISNRIGYALGSNRRIVRLAQVAVMLGNTELALSLLAEGIRACRSTGDRWIVAMVLVAAASLTHAQGNAVQAARYLGIARELVDNFGTHLWLVDRKLYENYQRILQNQLGKDVFSKAQEQSQRSITDPEQALDIVVDGLKSASDARPSGKAKKMANGGLTSREFEIASLIAQGRNNTEIARDLFVGVRTVETHITHILTKLNFSSRTQIAVWATNRKLN
jgi:non-specific serine/threonine protein kinase